METGYEKISEIVKDIRAERGRGADKLTRMNLLFSGPKGSGKKEVARLLASEVNMDFYRVNPGKVSGKYIGETEKNIDKYFDMAEKKRAVLFFDEADAIVGKRTAVKDSEHRFVNAESNYLMQRVENYDGIVIIATNDEEEIDRRFLPNFKYVIDFPTNGLGDRRTNRIWNFFSGKR